MKNLRNLVPVFAFIVGLSLVFTQSAFTIKTDTPTHYNIADANDPADWQPLGTIVIGTEEGEFSCVSNPERECLATKSGEVYTPVAYGELMEN